MKKIVCLSMFAVVLGAPALGAPADCLDQANKAVFFAWDAVLESVPNARANVSPEELTSGGETQAGQNGGSDRYIYKNSGEYYVSVGAEPVYRRDIVVTLDEDCVLEAISSKETFLRSKEENNH